MDAPNSEFYFLKPRRRFPGYKPVSMTDVSGRREAMKTSSLARAAWVGDPSPRRFTFRKSSCFLESLDVGDEAGCIACHVTGRIFIVQAVAGVRRGLGILKSGARTL